MIFIQDENMTDSVIGVVTSQGRDTVYLILRIIEDKGP